MRGPSSAPIPAADAAAMRAAAVPPTPERVAEIERKTDHDLAAFVDAVRSSSDPKGAGCTTGSRPRTSSTPRSRCRSATRAGSLTGSTARSPPWPPAREEHRSTICIGRSHGIHAEPTTFGWKLAGWAFELDRDRDRLAAHSSEPRRPALGTVGTYAALDPEVERIACERLGLEPDPLSTQVIARDRHAELLAPLALVRHVARSVRDRDPAPRPHRGARGRGAVRRRG